MNRLPGPIPVLAGIALVMLVSPVFTGETDSVLSRYDFEDPALTQWKLPKKLREISGLVYDDGRLFGHDDQQGIVYQIDYREARLIKAFALGHLTVQADFEGIAVVDKTFYLVTSAGRLYFSREGNNGERVPYKSYTTGLGNRCEIEGLAHDAANERLLLVCKQARSRELKNHVAIFVWSLEQRRILERETIMIESSAIHRHIPGKKFNPSGIEVDTQTGHILLVAARQRALAEIDREGNVITAFELPRAALHRQTEGIALTPDNELILADEGGTKKARLAIYRSGS